MLTRDELKVAADRARTYPKGYGYSYTHQSDDLDSVDGFINGVNSGDYDLESG